MLAKHSEQVSLVEVVSEVAAAEARKIVVEVELCPPDTLLAGYHHILWCPLLHLSLQLLYSPDLLLLSRSLLAVVSCPQLVCSEDCLWFGTAMKISGKGGHGIVPVPLSGHL